MVIKCMGIKDLGYLIICSIVIILTSPINNRIPIHIKHSDCYEYIML
jgi:hypothetical protein